MFFFFFKQKTAYEVRIIDWSSDVCSSDLAFSASPCSVVLSESVEPQAARGKATSAVGARRIRNCLIMGVSPRPSRSGPSNGQFRIGHRDRCSSRRPISGGLRKWRWQDTGNRKQKGKAQGRNPGNKAPHG